MSRCATRPACLTIDYHGPLLRNGRFRVGTCMQSWKVGRGSSKLCPWIRGHEAFTKAASLLPHTWKWVWIECNPHTSSPTPRQLGLSHLQFCIMFLHVSPCFSKPLFPLQPVDEDWRQGSSFFLRKESFLNKAGTVPRHHHDETEFRDIFWKNKLHTLFPNPHLHIPPCQAASSFLCSPSISIPGREKPNPASTLPLLAQGRFDRLTCAACILPR